MKANTHPAETVLARVASPLTIGVLCVTFAGLAGRLLAIPLGRDENLFIAAGMGWPGYSLYRDLGYNHLPNFPVLLSGANFLTGAAYPLLTGRLIVLGAWGAALAALWLIGKTMGASILSRVAAMVLLMCNVLLLGGPGILATNNFLPIPCALFAFYFLLRALREERTSATSAFLAGAFASLAIGFKSNYVFLAPAFALTTMLVPSTRTPGTRFKAALAPLALGGLIGGLPTIVFFLADPQSMLAHTVRYFTELQPAYWDSSTEPQISTLSQRILLAELLWLSNATLLTLAGLTALMMIAPVVRGVREGCECISRWPFLLAVSLAAMGFVVTFVPLPSFPQYFVPPVPFLILAIIVVASFLETNERTMATPILMAIILFALVGAASRILPGVVSLVRPATWTPVALHREGAALATAAGLKKDDRIATLTPVMAIEAGRSIYPEFAAGQFVYRVAPFIPANDRPFYRTTSERELSAFLDKKAPAAILVNQKEPMETTFANYALSHGYQEVRLPRGKRTKFMHLYRRMD